jgi:hypothetical protein
METQHAADRDTSHDNTANIGILGSHPANQNPLVELSAQLRKSQDCNHRRSCDELTDLPEGSAFSFPNSMHQRKSVCAFSEPLQVNSPV